jgi:DUF971 family protein
MPPRLVNEPGDNAASRVWPSELVVNRAERVLKITFNDGKSFALSAEYLRTQSPSAEVQGHSESQRQTIGGKREVAITGMEPVGNYAVRIQFDDGHDTGLFSWAYLHELGRDEQLRWKKYLQELSDKGLRRDK